MFDVPNESLKPSMKGSTSKIDGCAISIVGMEAWDTCTQVCEVESNSSFEVPPGGYLLVI